MSVWIGGHSSAGTWTWSGKSTTEMHSALWKLGQPVNEHGNASCVYSSAKDDFNLDNADCNIKYPYLCERII